MNIILFVFSNLYISYIHALKQAQIDDFGYLVLSLKKSYNKLSIKYLQFHN